MSTNLFVAPTHFSKQKLCLITAYFPTEKCSGKTLAKLDFSEEKFWKTFN